MRKGWWDGWRSLSPSPLDVDDTGVEGSEGLEGGDAEVEGTGRDAGGALVHDLERREGEGQDEREKKEEEE